MLQHCFFTFTSLSNNVEAMLKKKFSNSYSLEEKIVHKPVISRAQNASFEKENLVVYKKNY